MPRNVSDTLKQEVFNQETAEVFIVLLTISHENFDDDIRVASEPLVDLPDAGVKGVISNGLEYLYLPFDFQLPNQDDTGVARATLNIDNVDRRIVAAVRQANSAVGISMQVVRASDVDTPEVTVVDFKLERVTYNALVVSGEISVEYYDTEPFPQGRFTPGKWPGIF